MFHVKRALIVLAFCAVTLLGGCDHLGQTQAVNGAAERIPPSMLQVEYRNCLQGPGVHSESFCRCTVTEIDDRYTFDQYKGVVAGLPNSSRDEAIRHLQQDSKFSEIAVNCAAREPSRSPFSVAPTAPTAAPTPGRRTI